MQTFQLPVLAPDMTLNRAFGALYEGQLSAGVVVRPRGEFRLVTYDHMTEAMAHGAKRLNVVRGYTRPKLGAGVSAARANDMMRSHGGAGVGLVRVFTRNANLFATSENFGQRFTSPSNVRRCDRPNKPRGVSNIDWYHYYPPFDLPLPIPHDCIAAGCDGTIR
jgi:hypothetical protein